MAINQEKYEQTYKRTRTLFMGAVGVLVLAFVFLSLFYIVSPAPRSFAKSLVHTDPARYEPPTARVRDTNKKTLKERIVGYGFENYRAIALASLPQLGPRENGTTEPVFEPERILVNGVEIDLPVLNPESTDISVLDEALKEGAVRYPLSARLGEEGNIFIFGHSSGLPIVRNQMYKAFNDLPDLEAGDTITLIGGGKRYEYRVEDVRLTNASEELVDLTPRGGKRLTLSTCNSFGQKSERWVVEAVLVGEFINA